MNDRLQLIQHLIQTQKVHSQEELAVLLAKNGVQATQATLSRDLRKLHITKQHDAAGGYHYVLPGQALQSRVGDSIVGLEMSGQMGVVKTLPGCAGMVGALVDEHEIPGLMGTIAGDDTLLLVLREKAGHTAFLACLEEFIPGITDKLTLKTE